MASVAKPQQVSQKLVVVVLAEFACPGCMELATLVASVFLWCWATVALSGSHVTTHARGCRLGFLSRAVHSIVHRRAGVQFVSGCQRQAGEGRGPFGMEERLLLMRLGMPTS